MHASASRTMVQPCPRNNQQHWDAERIFSVLIFCLRHMAQLPRFIREGVGVFLYLMEIEEGKVEGGEDEGGGRKG